MNIYVLDTSALLVLYIPVGSVTCVHVLDEVRSVSVRDIVAGLVDGGVIEIREPGEDSVGRVVNISRELGEVDRLSKADIHVLALALELHGEGHDVKVCTDDYSIQNILSHVGIEYEVVRRGISRVIRWGYRCRVCGKMYESIPENAICPLCGGNVVRVPLIK